jgi:L-threonylcarbamoyladenylate synthase
MGGITPMSRIVIEQTGWNEIEFVLAVGMRRRASATFTKACGPTISARDRIESDRVFTANPAETGRCRVEDGIAISARDFSTLRTMALPDRPDLPHNFEAYRSAKTTTPNWIAHCLPPALLLVSESGHCQRKRRWLAPDFVETLVLSFGPHAIAKAAALIAEGQCVAVPTETVYGLAADATNGAAVAGIYAAKGRPSFNPLIVHVSDLTAAERIAVFGEAARTLADSYWPGPLTLVLPFRNDSGIASLVTAGLRTIAIRIPAHPAMRALLAACGKPLAAPSANASGTISPTRAEHVLKSLNGRIPLVLDAGPTEMGLESTIVAVQADGAQRLLRPGPIDLGLKLNESVGIEAPGQLASHYSPSKPLRLGAASAYVDEWFIAFGEMVGDSNLSPSKNLTEAATRLFDALHEADASPKPRIAVATIPDMGLGLAINDRLKRAAA